MSLIFDPNRDSTEQMPVGGKVSASTVLGTISGISAGASVLSPATSIITAPLAGLAAAGSAIARLFGGSLSEGDLTNMSHKMFGGALTADEWMDLAELRNNVMERSRDISGIRR